jgi:hypothetical protein
MGSSGIQLSYRLPAHQKPTVMRPWSRHLLPGLWASKLAPLGRASCVGIPSARCHDGRPREPAVLERPFLSGFAAAASSDVMQEPVGTSRSEIAVVQGPGAQPLRPEGPRSVKSGDASGGREDRVERFQRTLCSLVAANSLTILGVHYVLAGMLASSVWRPTFSGSGASADAVDPSHLAAS